MQPKASAPWAAFQYRIFTIVWVATVLSNIGTWMYNAAAGWLMTNLTSDALIVSLVQVANALPMFMFAILAGVLSDIIDKRRFLIAGEVSIAILSAIFAAMVWFCCGLRFSSASPTPSRLPPGKPWCRSSFRGKLFPLPLPRTAPA